MGQWNRFKNKCFACKFNDGIKHNIGEHYSQNAKSNCKRLISAVISQGCSQFQPKYLGCHSNCFYFRSTNYGPGECSKNIDILEIRNQPCDYYAISDDYYEK